MKRASKLAVALVLGFGISGPLIHVSDAAAQDATSIVRSLSTPTVKYRSFQPPTQKEMRVRKLFRSFETTGTRAITVEERKDIAAVVKESGAPSVDLEVFFEYDSAAVTAAAKPKLKSLGQALSDKKLKGKTFMIAGHTDAKGSDAYNQSLSQRRAESVKRFLVDNFGLTSKKLVVIGFGEEQLKDKADPNADENRRVQVVNMPVN